MLVFPVITSLINARLGVFLPIQLNIRVAVITFNHSKQPLLQFMRNWAYTSEGGRPAQSIGCIFLYFLFRMFTAWILEIFKICFIVTHYQPLLF